MNLRDFHGTESVAGPKVIVARIYFTDKGEILGLIAKKVVPQDHLIYCTVILYIKLLTICDFRDFYE